VSSIGRESCSSVADPLFLLDANICIYILTGASDAAAKAVERRETGSVVTSSIAYAEVVHGIPETEIDAMRHAQRFFALVEPLPFDRMAASTYARLPFKRARFDRLIAAHAVSLGLTLVTNNERDFADVAELKVENWTL
jgi:tRNA(fMet)-specific endonuclease VapC